MSAPSEHAELLAAVADELSSLREGMHDVEALVSRLVRLAAAEDRPATLTQAQALDALTQRMEALSSVLRKLSGGASPAEAVSGVGLTDMAGRLRPMADEATSSAVMPGDVALF